MCCDGPPTNISFSNMMGVSMDPENFVTKLQGRDTFFLLGTTKYSYYFVTAYNIQVKQNFEKLFLNSILAISPLAYMSFDQ